MEYFTISHTRAPSTLTMASLPPPKRRKTAKPKVIRDGDVETTDAVVVTTAKNRKGRTKLIKTPVDTLRAAQGVTAPTQGPSSHVNAAPMSLEAEYEQEDYSHQPAGGQASGSLPPPAAAPCRYQVQ